MARDQKATLRRESEMIVDESEEEKQMEENILAKRRGEDVEMTDEEGDEAAKKKL
jgi:hypothetical protein